MAEHVTLRGWLLIILVLTITVSLLFVLYVSTAEFAETEKEIHCQCVEQLSVNISSAAVNSSSMRRGWRETYVEPLSANLSSAEAHQIAVDMLSHQWVYIVGDSSMRMFFRALIHIIEPEFDDSHFGSFTTHDKGGCTTESDGNTGGGCLREYFDHTNNIRLTFSFKTLAKQTTLALDWLISGAFAPDIIIGATGAWDIYASGNGDVNDTAAWYSKMSSSYSSAQLLAVTTVACPPFRDIVTAYNGQVTERLLSMRLPRFAILDRQASTFPVQNSSVCEGFHAYGDLVLMHVHAFLGNL
jgi:hypothetical protein